MKVCKFGGSSLADSTQVKKAIDIIEADPARQYVIVSAPGKRTPEDTKVTDLFYLYHRAMNTGVGNPFPRLAFLRFNEIRRSLQIPLRLGPEFNEIAVRMREGASADYAASRGEYLMGKILAEALGFEFVDPASCISFDKNGQFDGNYDKLLHAISGKQCVIPGFYGAGHDGAIRTFPRGGSDITGALVARAVEADVYENWTDVSGMLMADPHVVDHPRPIDVITYDEIRELAYMGANVFHEEAMFPVQESGIPIHILNTNRPDDHGTHVIANDDETRYGSSIITGIAGRPGSTMIVVKKAMMNRHPGFIQKVLGLFEGNGVSCEHMPNIDTLSVIVDEKKDADKIQTVIKQIHSECLPGAVAVYPGLAMIAVVGRAMVHTSGTSARIFKVLADHDINVRTINQGPSELNIIIGVETCDYEDAIRAIYAEFVPAHALA